MPPFFEHRLQAVLGRAEELLAQPGLAFLVDLIGNERERKIEAAGAHQLTQRLEARLYDVTLPTSNLRPILTAPLRQLTLREPSSQARLPDQHPACHAVILACHAHKLLVRLICYTSLMPRVSPQQLELELVHPETPAPRITLPAQPVIDGGAAAAIGRRPAPENLLETPGALLTRSDLRDLGLERRAIDAVFRRLPIVALPGYSRPMIHAEGYLELIDEYTYDDDRVRPLGLTPYG